MAIRALQKKDMLLSALSLCALILVVVVNAYPSIFEGIDNPRIIKHFSSDENEIIGFYTTFYKDLFMTPPTIVSYPTFFYYVAGSFLFPYSHAHADSNNHAAVAVTFRALNTFSIILTIVLLYFLALYFLSSHLLSFISTLLIITTPGYLYWGLNSRPHPFEILLLVTSLILGLSFVKQKKAKPLWWCMVAAGFAFATKYGGMFMIPPIVIFVAWFLWSDPVLLTSINRRIFRVNTFAGSLIVILALGSIGAAYFILIPLAATITKIGAALGANGLTGLALFKAVIICLILLSLFGCCWIALNLYAKRRLQALKNLNQGVPKKDLLVLLINCILSFLFIGSLIFCTIFIFTNPHCLLHPIATARSFFGLGIIEFSFSQQGKGLLLEWVDNFAWFKLLFDKHNLGISGIAFLLWYFTYELTRLKENLRNRKTVLLQRLFIWCFIGTNFGFLMFFIKFRAPHYLLLITFMLWLLFFLAIKEHLDSMAQPRVKQIAIAVFSFLVMANLYERMPTFLRYYNFVHTKESDAGLEIGTWLEENYAAKTIIWSDTKEFYIPEKFPTLHAKWWYEDINGHLNSIASINPGLIIISGAYEEEPVSAEKIINAIASGTLKDFRLIKTFNYHGPLTLQKGRIGLYRKIYIFENKDHSAGLS